MEFLSVGNGSQTRGILGGGILVGVKADILEVETWNKGRHFVAANIRDRLKNFRWTLIVV